MILYKVNQKVRERDLNPGLFYSFSWKVMDKIWPLTSRPVEE